MSADRPGRVVYSTGRGRVCAGCGHPADRCACARSHAAEEPVPARITATLQLERQGRGGKTVTVVAGLPRNEAFLRDLAGELKRACGTGGNAGDGAVELQGDRRAQLRDLLERKGFVVKG
jgi:translation initiation factor 1